MLQQSAEERRVLGQYECSHKDTKSGTNLKDKKSVNCYKG